MSIEILLVVQSSPPRRLAIVGQQHPMKIEQAFYDKMDDFTLTGKKSGKDCPPVQGQREETKYRINGRRNDF